MKTTGLILGIQMWSSAPWPTGPSRLNAFIDYFNTVLAKPFQWTYAGKLLCGA